MADDHELMRRGIRGLLHAQRGWTVVGEAANGKEAVEKVRKLTPSLAILDIEMPELDGLETTRRIREEAPNTQILILTMHGSGQMVRRVLEAGAHGYVMKSDLPRQLVRAVKDVARGKLFLAPSVSEVVLEEFLKAGKESSRTQESKANLTPRQLQIVRLLAEGKGNKEIGVELGITTRTVESHRAKIMLKLGLHSLTELVHYAIRNKIVSPFEP